MAGGGSLGGAEREKRGDAGNRKKPKRVGFHLDFTPLVDITFLLLTFFLLTTTMATPQVMEMSVPPEWQKEVEVEESKLMSIFLTRNNNIYWALGQKEPEETKLKNIQEIAERENLKPGVVNELITVLIVSEDADYGMVVKVLDQLNLAEIAITNEISDKVDEEGKPMKRKRRFTIANMKEKDLERLPEKERPKSSEEVEE